jgi:hypothetical protein
MLCWESITGPTRPAALPALRGAIAATYDNLAAEDVLCFAGAEEPVPRRARARRLSAGSRLLVRVAGKAPVTRDGR